MQLFPHLQAFPDLQPFPPSRLVSDPSECIFTGATPVMMVTAVVAFSEEPRSGYILPHLQSLPQPQLEPQPQPDMFSGEKGVIEKDFPWKWDALNTKGIGRDL